jgi:hypothetical protein
MHGGVLQCLDGDGNVRPSDRHFNYDGAHLLFASCLAAVSLLSVCCNGAALLSYIVRGSCSELSVGGASSPAKHH